MNAYRSLIALAILFSTVALAEAQQPESPTIAASQKSTSKQKTSFPKDWLGHWRGTIITRNTDGNEQSFQMDLTIAPTDQPDRWTWTIVYEGALGRSERPYTLVAKDAANGRFVIDENNSIEIDATFIGDTLLEHFTVQGQTIWSSTRLIATGTTREIQFELVSADDSKATTSGGKNGIPGVSSLSVNSRQFGVLKPIEATKSEPAKSTLTAWKKLDTEAYRGKQDDIYFVNENVGWYVNGSGKIFKTIDSGTTWTQQLHKPGTYFRCVAFIDEQHGFAGNIGPGYFPNVTDATPLYETNDGGNTWTAVDSIEGKPIVGLCAMQVLREPFINAGKLDSRVRIIGVGRVGGPTAMIVSDDLGKSWQQIDIAEHAAMAFDVHFFNRNEGFIAAASNADVSQSNALILSTTDGGKTWTKSYQSTRPFELTWKISFPTRNVGYVTIQSYNSDPSIVDRFVAKTIDGGKSWSEVALVSDPKVREFGVAFIDENQGWVGAVPNGFQTTDGGQTWAPADIGNAVNKIRLLKTDTKRIGFAIGVNVFRFETPIIQDISKDSN